MSLPTRHLGALGPVPAIGFGAFFREPVDEDAFTGALAHALARGIRVVDTADVYGEDGQSERLVGRALRGRDRDDVVVCTKFGLRTAVWPSPTGARAVELGGGRAIRAPFGATMHVDADPARIPQYLEASLARLGLDHVDLYSPHYPDPGVPIEEVVGTVGELVAAGKVRHVGLSNVDADLLRRAHAVHPIAVVQNQYSQAERTPETDVLPAARELGVGFVCWGPLARGGAPAVAEAAERTGLGVHQLALAWLLHHAPDVLPIPGMQLAAHVDANLAALALEVDDATLAALDAAADEPQARPWLEDYRAIQG